ncbi:MAG: hypothetical protein ACJATA_001344 [Sphingobacteriales bacterium]|jgi:hypothetical protein
MVKSKEQIIIDRLLKDSYDLCFHAIKQSNQVIEDLKGTQEFLKKAKGDKSSGYFI